MRWTQRSWKCRTTDEQGEEEHSGNEDSEEVKIQEEEESWKDTGF